MQRSFLADLKVLATEAYDLGTGFSIRLTSITRSVRAVAHVYLEGSTATKAAMSPNSEELVHEDEGFGEGMPYLPGIMESILVRLEVAVELGAFGTTHV